MKRGRGVSLSLLLPALVIGLFGLLMVFAALHQQRFLLGELEARSGKEVRHQMAELQRLMAEALLDNQPERAERALTTLGARPEIAALAAVDERGVVLYGTRFEWRLRLAAEAVPGFDETTYRAVRSNRRAIVQLSEDKSAWYAYYPLTLSRQAGEIRPTRVGTLFLEYDLSGERDAIWHGVARSTGLVVLGGMLLISALIATLHSQVSRPVGRLVRSAERLAAGEHGILVRPSGAGELVALGDAFNAMSREIKRSMDAQRESEQRWQFALEGAGDGVWDWDTQSERVYYSPRWKEILGYADGEISDALTEWESRVHPDDRAAVHVQLVRHLQGERPFYESEHRIRCRDGSYKWVLDRGKAVQRDRDGHPLRVIGTLSDITARKQADEALRRSEQKLALHMRQTPLAVIEWDTDFRVVEWNPGAERIFGYGRQEALGRHAADLILLSETGEQLGEIWRHLLTGEGGKRSTNENLTRDGRIILCEWYNTPLVQTDGEIIGVASLALDVTERRLAQQKIERMAFFDELTGLPNRRLLLERLQLDLPQAREEGYFGALMFIDLDNFKTINDSLGHPVGDSLLQQVAQRLGDMIRTDDTVARLGGDEFVLLLPRLSRRLGEARSHAEVVAQKVHGAFAQRFELSGASYPVTPSIGVVLFPQENQGVDDLLKQADTAMYESKQAGRNTVTFYHAGMQVEADDRLLLDRALRDALTGDELELYYQPQVRIDGGQLIGAEALLRWRHPERGLVSPAEFIPIAEETGLIAEVDVWVLRRALAQLRVWLNRGLMGDLRSFAVNVSARLFRRPELVELVGQLIEEAAVPAHYLTLELTERLFLEDLEETIDKMRRLRQIGVQFSMDDFGTGYSSLSYLKRLPLNHLKVDKSFVQDVGVDPNDAVIVETILAMARHLGLEVIAEGVETEQQLEFLRLQSCNAYQGYLFSKPVSAEGFERLLRGEGSEGRVA